MQAQGSILSIYCSFEVKCVCPSLGYPPLPDGGYSVAYEIPTKRSCSGFVPVLQQLS
jgi:hypothetical protein